MNSESTQDAQDLPGSAGCFALESASEPASAAHNEPKKKPRKKYPWDQPRTFSRMNSPSGSLPIPPTPSQTTFQHSDGCWPEFR